MTGRLVARGVCLWVGLIWATPAAWGNVLLTNSPGYLGYCYGGYLWTGFNNELWSRFDAVRVVTDLSSPAAFSGIDAVMFVPREPGEAPHVAELANLAGFIAAGKRTLLIGEGSLWADWNSALLGLLGGGYGGGTAMGYTNAVLSHPLTDGAPLLYLTAGVAPGGTQLYDRGFAALWRPGQTVLTVLDVNVFDNHSGGYAFARNVAAWLAAPATPTPGPSIPEPGTLAVLGLAWIASGLLRRRDVVGMELAG